MSDYTAVDSGAMAQGIGDLRQAHDRLSAQLDELTSELSGSLSQWDGAARNAYTDAKAKWDAAAQHMAQVINTMGTTMSQITDNYDHNERQIQGSWA